MIKKTCIISGGNSGIGKAAAIQIARKGYRVIICCRNAERGEKALDEIRSASNSKDVDLVLLDLASKESISRAAAQLIQKSETLDVLIHNAADFDISRKKPEHSPDGIETVWASNYIGPVLLTKKLLDKIKLSENGRIITIASKGLVMYPNLQVDLSDPEFNKRKYSVAKAYYQSKLALLMYTYWLAEQMKETKITVNCIRVTNVKIDISRYPDLSRANKLAYALKSLFSISVEKMAETYTLLACGENLETVTGKYFDENNKIVTSSKYSRDKDNIHNLMELTWNYL